MITASLSSYTYNKASWWEDLTFEGVKSTLSKSLITLWDYLRFWIVWDGERTSRLFINRSSCSLWLWFVSPRTATIRSHKSSAGIPPNLNPASKEMISDSVELYETEVCFLHVQLVGTNVWLAKTHNVPPEVDFESSRSHTKTEFEAVAACIVLQCYPHNNNICIHMCDGYKISNDLIVCQKLWSTLRLIVQVYSLTKEYQIFQYVPSTSISKQIESILLTIHPRISILLLWSDGRQDMGLILCRVILSSFLLTHSIVPHISWNDLQYRKTKKRYTYFPSMVIFRILPRKFVTRKWICKCQQYPYLFQIVFEYIPGFHHQGKTLVLPYQLLYWVLSTSDQFFPVNLMSSTQTDKNNPFSRCTNKHSQFETFSQMYFNRIFSNDLSHKGPVKGWSYRFRSRGTTDLLYWVLILTICVVINESKCLDIPILEFSIFLRHLPFYLEISRYCVTCLFVASWQSGNDIHDFCCCHLWYWWFLLDKYCIRSRIIFHNVVSEYNSTFVFLMFCLQIDILQMTDVYQWDKMNFCVLRPSFIDHLFFTSDFRQVARRNLFQFLPFFIHCCLCCGNLHGMRHRNKFVSQILCCSELSPFPAIWTSRWFGKDFFHTQSCVFTDFQNTRKFWFDLIGFITGHRMLTCLVCLTRHSRSHWRFQALSSILDGFFEFLVLRVNEINSSWFSDIIEFWFFMLLLLPLLQLDVSSQFRPEFLSKIIWPVC